MLEWLIGYLSLLKCDAGWHIHWINWLVLGCVWSERLIGNKAGFGSRKQLVKNFISSWAGETHTPMVYISWVYWILISSKIQLVTIYFVFLPLCKGSQSLFISWVLFHLRVNTQHLNIAATIFFVVGVFLKTADWSLICSCKFSTFDSFIRHSLYTHSSAWSSFSWAEYKISLSWMVSLGCLLLIQGLSGWRSYLGCTPHSNRSKPYAFCTVKPNIL